MEIRNTITPNISKSCKFLKEQTKQRRQARSFKCQHHTEIEHRNRAISGFLESESRRALENRNM
tara:strand:- start:115 stop:306 length:192 start_codon:yes stop_codon:yes gene_type:complete